MRKVLSHPHPPTAIFIADPLVAEGAINESHRVGVNIPDDISILGFDDTDTRNAVYPVMTAICQDSRELGRRAFELLVRRTAKRPGKDESICPGRGVAGGQPYDGLGPLEIHSNFAQRRPAAAG